MIDIEIKKRLAENMKKFRKREKISQELLAEKSDLTVDSIRSIETCRSFVSDVSLAAIATALNVDVYELFLPVPSSFEIDSKIKKSIIDTARKSFKNFLDTVKDEI